MYDYFIALWPSYMAPPKSAAALIGRVQKHSKFGTIIVWRGQCKHFKQTISRRAHGTRSSTSSISTKKKSTCCPSLLQIPVSYAARICGHDLHVLFGFAPAKIHDWNMCLGARFFITPLDPVQRAAGSSDVCVCVLCVFAVISVHIFLLLSCVCLFCLLCFVFYVCTLKTGPRNVCPFAGCLISTSKKAFSAPRGLGIWWIQSTKCIFESA